MAFTGRSVASDTVTTDMVLALGGTQMAADSGFRKVLAQLVRIIRDHFANTVYGKVVAGAETTASTQQTGATGVTEVRVNLAAFKVVVNGQEKEFTAEADRVLHDTTVYTGADAGTGDTTLTTTAHHAVITIVAKSDSAVVGSGTISLVNCKGACATTAAGAQLVKCTNAEIQTKVGAGLPWVVVAEVLLDRSADTTLAVTHDHTRQPCLTVNQDNGFFRAFAD